MRHKNPIQKEADLMTAHSHHADAPITALESLIPFTGFRTVAPTNLRFPGGVNEIRTTMNLREDFIAQIAVNPTTDGQTVYGFTRVSPAISELFGGFYEKDRKACELSFSDWGERVLLLAEVPGKWEKAVFVMRSEVKYLLDNCLRAPLV